MLVGFAMIDAGNRNLRYVVGHCVLHDAVWQYSRVSRRHKISDRKTTRTAHCLEIVKVHLVPVGRSVLKIVEIKLHDLATWTDRE